MLFILLYSGNILGFSAGSLGAAVLVFVSFISFAVDLSSCSFSCVLVFLVSCIGFIQSIIWRRGTSRSLNNLFEFGFERLVFVFERADLLLQSICCVVGYLHLVLDGLSHLSLHVLDLLP